MPRHPNRIVVPQRQVQSGFDFKFETDPYNVELYALLTRDQYTDAITAVNERLRPSRSGTFDGVLLAAGPLIVPLAWWGIRHRNQAKRRKRLLHKAISEFNEQYPNLYMRWNRRPESKLTIERRAPLEESNPNTTTATTAASPVMAEAEFVSDVIAPVVQPMPTMANYPTTGGQHNNTVQNSVGHSMV